MYQPNFFPQGMYEYSIFFFTNTVMEGQRVVFYFLACSCFLNYYYF